ncbi:nucleotide exchange factor GrpE [Mycoplasma phocoeninasale]|uniref:nucleotide exchange factor GrpE n=1 Tax=Mycoplasma phocoeninasale TaxID=2726117 RepID=UPI001967805B|nr:nucleotide exchange factor GrpE [Mycoplasma phocoeninasale]MBN0970426.1 nucleotide exchange factor GrpE [Mycoplasma phocoeninasale]
MSKKINEFDYVEFVVMEKSQKDFKDEEIQKGFFKTNTFDKEIEDVFETTELDDNNEIKCELERGNVVIKVLKRTETPELYRNVLENYNKSHNDVIEAQMNAVKLLQKVEQLNSEIVENEKNFRKQLIDLQQAAQNQLNEHKQKNDEHIANQTKEIKDYALQSFLEDLLTPLNNFEIAINSAKDIDNPIVQNFVRGFEMLYTQIDTILNDHGVEKIIPIVGEKFDPNIHQAFELTDEGDEPEAIVLVKNIGYKLHNRTIKPALVVVKK